MPSGYRISVGMSLTNTYAPATAIAAATTAPSIVSTRGCRYVAPTTRARCAATSIVASHSGRISPLSAPTSTRVRTGRPTSRKITVEIPMNAITTRVQCASRARCSPRRKLTDV
jgi:hypothetical protein